MQDKSVEVVIGERKFRVGLVPAHIGSWIITLFQSNRLLDEEFFQKAQGYGFEACHMLINANGLVDAPVPIFRRPAQWLIPDLADDSETASLLWDEVVKFNFTPFLKRTVGRLAALKKAEQDILDGIQVTAP